MAEQLQRSVTSFRRQGSSGLVWDDKLISAIEDSNQTRPNQEDNEKAVEPEELRQSQSVGSTVGSLERSKSVGARPYRTVTVAPPSNDPPSPKIATCGLCGFFGKSSAATRKSKSKTQKRRGF